MSIFDKFLDRFETEDEPEPQNIQTDKTRYVGKIVKLDKGWGFIVSQDLPYTRIFFHWSALNQDTKRFTELEKGDMAEFEVLSIEGRGLRAIRMKILDKE